MAAISRKELEAQIARAYAAGYRKGYDEGYLDAQSDYAPDKPELYIEWIERDNETIPHSYRFGSKWAAAQLAFEGGYSTADAAYIAWHKEMMKDDDD